MGHRLSISEGLARQRALTSLRRQENPQAPELPLEDAPVIQRPNAVPRDGGPQLLRGLMIPMPPSANSYWSYRTIKPKAKGVPAFASKYVTEEGKAFQRAIADLAVERRIRFATQNRLRVDVVACFATKRRCDLDNRLKPLLDALKEAQVFEDDEQIDDLRIRRGPLMPGGRLILSLWEVKTDLNQVLLEAWR